MHCTHAFFNYNFPALLSQGKNVVKLPFNKNKFKGKNEHDFIVDGVLKPTEGFRPCINLFTLIKLK